MKFSYILILLSLCAVFGCKNSFHNQNKSEEELLSQLIFSKTAMKMDILIEFGGLNTTEPVILVYADTKNKIPSDTWTEAGTACCADDIMKILATVPSKYDNGEFQIKIPVADNNGCRKIYHRKPSLKD